MGSTRRSLAMVAVLLSSVACTGGAAPQEAPEASPTQQSSPTEEATTSETAQADAATEATEAPEEPTFTTGDLEHLVLAGDKPPKGMLPGPREREVSPYGLGTVAENDQQAGHGLLLLRSQSFTTISALEGRRPKPGAMGFYSLGSRVAIYEDAAGASADFNSPRPPTNAQRDYDARPLDAELGEEAQRIQWREKSSFGGIVPFVGLTWRRANAVFTLQGYGVKADGIDEDALLALAQKQDGAAVPSGDPALELPEVFIGGQSALEDDFSDPDSGWKEEAFTGASSGYRRGTWAMRLDEGGFLAFADEVDEGLAEVGDVRVDFEATVAKQGAAGSFCRYRGKNPARARYYVASVDTRGSVRIGHVTGGKDSQYVSLASVEGAEFDRQSHDLRMFCLGDDTVRLQLLLDGKLVAEGVHLDKPIADGSVGLYVETRRGPASVTFDNVEVTVP